MKNYFVAAGLNSIGILTGGGLGRVLAHWIINGRPDVDITGMNIDRLHTYQSNPEYRRTRTVESLGMVYQCHYPTRSMTTARDAKRSPFTTAWRRRARTSRTSAAGKAPTGTPARARRRTPGPLSWGRQRLVPELGGRAPAPRARASSSWTCPSCRSSCVQGRDAGQAAEPALGQQRRRRARASSPTRSGSTRAARSRPTSPSPSSTTSTTSWSPPTRRTATSRRG